MPNALLVSGMLSAAAGRSPWVEALVRGTVLLLLLFVMAPALRRASAGLRHLVWSAGLVGVLLLPLLATSLPRVRVLPWATASSVTATPLPPVASALAVRVAEPAPLLAPSAGPAPATGPCDGCGSGAPAARSRAARGGGGGGGGAAAWSIMTWVLVIWGAGVALLLARLAAGALAVRRIGRLAEPLKDAGWTTPLYEASDRLELRSAPRLLMSNAVQLPFTARRCFVPPGAAAYFAAFSDTSPRARRSGSIAGSRPRKAR